MEIGIVGLPLSGKTTLFNLLTCSHAETGFAGGKKKVNLGLSRVPDIRVDRLAEIWSPKKTTYATIQYVDVAGVEKGSGKEGLAGEMLTALKNTDTLLVVVRAFDNEQVPHPEGSIDPLRDLETLQGEFLLSDLIIVEARLQRLAKQLKGKGERALELEQAVLQRCQAHLEEEQPLRLLELDGAAARTIRGFQFLTRKPLVIAVNVGEDDLDRAEGFVTAIEARWGSPSVTTLSLSATIEQEISELSTEDAAAFLADLGIDSSATDRILRSSYRLLGLISYFTMGEDECRAWTVPAGATAPQAAGVIHSDLERGFIRAEVVPYDDFVATGSQAACREKGLLRLEGKEYRVQDGDILNIRFNV